MEKGGDAALVCVGLGITLTLLSCGSPCLAYLLSEIFLLSRFPPPPPVLAKYLVLVAFPVRSRLLLYLQLFMRVSVRTNSVWLYLVLSVLTTV